MSFIFLKTENNFKNYKQIDLKFHFSTLIHIALGMNEVVKGWVGCREELEWNLKESTTSGKVDRCKKNKL